MRDDLYQSEDSPSAPFEFTRAVAEVFPDMIARTVPGYAATLRLIGSIADRYVIPGSRVFDLGCSLGAASFSVRRQIGDRAEITAVDLAEPMIDGLKRQILKEGVKTIHPQLGDVRKIEIENARLTLLNFTLQFVPVADRLALLSGIAEGTQPGGVLVLSEKICFEDPVVEEEMRMLHEAFKRENGYSELEVARKRNALENVLVPETLNTHRQRLLAAGFQRCDVWLQCFNFVSMIAYR